MTNGTENSRNFQISGKKDNRSSIYLILYRKFRLKSPVVILIGRWKQCSLDDLDKKDTRRPREQICLPVDNWPLFPPSQETFVTQRAVRAFNVSMAFWPRVFRNFRSELTWRKSFYSKRDTASIESELRWQDRYASLLWFYEGIGTSTDLFRFVLRAWLKYCSAFRYT